ncbi:HpcH/HpaI aldolase/citrate lyase family protein [Inediibacterium massiliense]|uniref:HpcH/HpaI aldolase/citrate lyase family protein n=1 Tax=Inediibacterium massiliense TaxID=1658111 RepID=UPI0006B443DB|nr:HpcH/HpaI aldolase/citrate lyase family protein [Inediibacterium massiliense]
MRYFSHLTPQEEKSIFYEIPHDFHRESPKEILSYALGATLYMPAVKENIAKDVLSFKYPITSMVICLEDAIGDLAVEKAEKKVVKEFQIIDEGVKSGQIHIKDIPFIFLRIRNKEQMVRLAYELKEYSSYLMGFVFPKFSVENGIDYFKSLKEICNEFGKKIYGMPILETKEIIYKEKRIDTLLKIRDILIENKEWVLNIRVGGTDFSSIFGIRRSPKVSIYDISMISDCLSDILNFFIREEGEFVVSGPVWEYFSDNHIDGFIHEILLDQENGFVGKTIIHPNHLKVAQSLYVVSHEEYMDALSIVKNYNGNVGVLKSEYKNKMNEIKPHLNWAKKILIKSKIYGVYHEGKNFTHLFNGKGL